MDHFQQTLRDVLAGDPDELKQNMIAGVLHGIALKGDKLLEQWQNSAAHWERPSWGEDGPPVRPPVQTGR